MANKPTKNRTLLIIILLLLLAAAAFFLLKCNGNSSGSNGTVDSTKTSFKLLGAWVSVENRANKIIFTADTLSEIEGSNPAKNHPYKWINEREIEVTDRKEKAKIAIAGDTLTMTIDNKDHKLVREGVAPPDNDPINTHLTPEEKVFKTKLSGTWMTGSERVIFSNDGRFISYYNYDSANLKANFYYQITSDSTVEWNSTMFKKLAVHISFSDENKKLKWKAPWGLFNLTLVSDNADIDLSGNLKSNVTGNWVGIAETASANERLSIYGGQWNRSTNNEAFTTQNYTITPDGKVTFNYSASGFNVSIEKDVLTTTEENGTVKKYNRLKAVVD